LITESSIVVASSQQISCDLDEEAAILDVTSGMYYGLNATGSFIWSLIQEPKTVVEIQQAMLEEYEVEPERCMRDVVTLLQELADDGLVEVKNAAMP
jgi:hypothetical protein